MKKEMKQKKLSKGTKIICIFVILLSILVIGSIMVEETNSGTQKRVEDSVVKQNVQCPKQGMLQTDWSYCVDLCIHDKGDDEYKTITKCENYCRVFERADDKIYASGLNPYILQRRNEKYQCELCGECTEEQLNN